MYNFELICQFLRDLQANNHKIWFDANRDYYTSAKEEYKKFVGFLIEEMSKFDDTLQDLDAAKCIFRINRDVRFSKDKSPYKGHFGAYFSKGGKNSHYAGYYVHIQPDSEYFAGGGVYHPEPEILKKIRQEIDFNSQELRQILDKPEFGMQLEKMENEYLRTMPKGYDASHPEAELLKLKSFVATTVFTPQEVVSQDFSNKVIDVFKRIKPLNDFLNRAMD